MSEIELDDNARLQHMLDAGLEALSFLAGSTRSTLDSNRMLSLALVKEIEIIGEAASKISKEFQDVNPQLPWPAIIGMRNRLVHAYFDIDVDRLWDTVNHALPPLIAELQKLLSNDST